MTDYDNLSVDFRNAIYNEAKRMLQEPISASDKPAMQQAKRAITQSRRRTATLNILAQRLARTIWSQQDSAPLYRVRMNALLDLTC